MFFRTFKKGFTLVELLAVIILLGLLGLIIYPTVNGVINTNKQKLHNKQIEELVRHANTYATTNITKLKTVDGARNVITFTDLYEAGIIHNDKVVDPLNDEELTGCMALTWKESTNSFDIKYIEDCNNSFNLSGKVTVTAPFSTVNNSNPTVQLLQGNQVIYETIALDDGSYEFNNVDGGTYLILVSKPTRTKYGREIEILSDITKDINALLYVGDFNEDGVVNNGDSNLLMNSKCYSTNLTENPECAKYDLNGDRFVNDADANYMFNTANSKKIDDIVYGGISNITGKISYNSDNQPTITLNNNTNSYTATINEDGRFSFDNIENGVYYFSIVKTSYTPYYSIITLKNNMVINKTIYAGDMNQDGKVDEEDQFSLENAIEKGYTPTTNVRKKFDINEDGVIDNIDLNILKSNLGKEVN